jgi:hypothetical protein
MLIEDKLLQITAEQAIYRGVQIDKAWQYYLGNHKSQVKGSDTILNFAKVLVNKAINALFGKDLQIEVKAQEEAQTNKGQVFLDGVLVKSKKSNLFRKLGQNGAITGHAFLKIVNEQPTPRLIVLDSQNVSAIWDPLDVDKVLAYVVQFPFKDASGMKVYREITEKINDNAWLITTQTSDERLRHKWETTDEVVWPYSFAPIADCQNIPLAGSYYGLPDLSEDVMELSDSVNFIASNIRKIIKFHGHPKTIAKGVNAKELQVDPDKAIVLTNPSADIHNLEMQSDLSSSLNFLNLLRSALHEISEIPEVATGKLENIGSLSGVALRILYQPLIDLTEPKQETYGDMLTDVCKRLLAIGGLGEKDTIEIHWPELLPSDIGTQIEQSIMLNNLGVSKDTLITRLGFDPELEKEKRSQEVEAIGQGLLSLGGTEAK